MSEEINHALSDLQHMHRLAARARSWKRAAKHERRGARFWHTHYLILRERYSELQGVAERRRQQAAWFARQLAAERSRRRDAEARAQAAEARAGDIVAKLIMTYMQLLPGREYVAPEQALAVLTEEWRRLAARAEDSAFGAEVSEGDV